MSAFLPARTSGGVVLAVLVGWLAMALPAAVASPPGNAPAPDVRTPDREEPPVSAEAPLGEPITVAIPLPAGLPDGLRPLSISGADPRLVEPVGLEIDASTLRWTVRVDRPGRFLLQGLEARLLDEAGEMNRVELPPVRLQINSVLDEDTTEPILTAGLLQMLSRHTPAPLLFGSLLGLLAFGWAARWWRRRPPPPPPPPIPADVEARAALDALHALLQDPPEDLRPCWEQLARILRRFVARTADVPAGERTTRELDALLRESPLDRYRPPLIAILRRSDHARFAGADAGADGLIEQVDALRRLLAPMARACAPPSDPEERAELPPIPEREAAP